MASDLRNGISSRRLGARTMGKGHCDLGIAPSCFFWLAGTYAYGSGKDTHIRYF
jgi:hypothetical protein